MLKAILFDVDNTLIFFDDIDPKTKIPVPDFKGSLSGVPDAVDALLMSSCQVPIHRLPEYENCFLQPTVESIGFPHRL
jgi:hypothetical protein